MKACMPFAVVMVLAASSVAGYLDGTEETDPQLKPNPVPVHGGQLTEVDKERMGRGIEAYVAEFGPLSRSNDHSGFAGTSAPLLAFSPFGGRVLRDTFSAGLADYLPASLACEIAVVECQVTLSDGITDGTPYTFTIEMDGPFTGDAECDGNPDCPGDFNGEGLRNGGDLGVLLACWGDC